MISVLALGKKGKLYLWFIVAAAILAAAIYSYSALAAVPLSTPAIVNTNTTTINGVTIVSYGSEVL